MDTFYFRRLKVYQETKNLVRYINNILKKYPIEENYAICSQIRRASTSIPINIAEGFSRFSAKEKVRFIEIAFGSLTELICEFEISLDLGYITKEEFDYIEKQLIIISKKLSALRNTILKNGDFNSE